MIRILIFSLLFFSITAQALEINERAPAFVFEDIFSKKVHRLQDYEGKVVLLTLWASWCNNCKRSMAFSEYLSQKLDKNAVAVVGICVDQNLENAFEFLKANKITFNNLRDKNDTAAALLQVVNIPSTFVIDQNGQILYIEDGHKPSNEAEIIRQIQMGMDTEQQINRLLSQQKVLHEKLDKLYQIKAGNVKPQP
jgi:alkyl hydroperoxide reductase subunit AhpC